MPRTGSAFALNGYTWPDGTQIQMHLQLDRPAVPLQDGSASWNASATDALEIWNQYVDTVKLVAASPMNSSGEDNANEVLFSTTIYGDSWPDGVLAVTLRMSTEGSVFTETDVLFNGNLKWNSYRGPVQGLGASATWDLHRVALHEFGHVLGLDHPDQHGQSVSALMNSTISNLDHLADDDVGGGQWLYGARIISSLNPQSIAANESFVYQIRANISAGSYDATGLPPGLSLDANSGLISGKPTLAGNFKISLLVHGMSRDVMGTLFITVIGSRVTSNLETVDIHAGDTFNYTVTATNNPFAFDASGLPAGLSFNRSTGVISGSPTAAGTFRVTIIAHTSFGDGSATFTIIVRPFEITSVDIVYGSLGGDLTYQISADNSPTTFEAIGLPAGLELNSATGLITGSPSLSGDYQFTLIAHGQKGDALGSLHIIVEPPPPLQPTPTGVVKSFDVPAKRLAFDLVRSRLYASDQTSSSILIVDAISLAPSAIIKLPHSPYGLAISADKKKLWAACSVSQDPYNGWIYGVDLDTLQVLPGIHLSGPILHVVEGSNQRLYGSGGDTTYEVDQATGTTVSKNFTQSGYLAAKPEQNLLFVGSPYSPPTVWAYETSQSPAQLREQTDFNTRGGSGGRDLKLSHNGKYLCFVDGQGNGRVFGATSTALMSTSDVRVVLGNFINSNSNETISVGAAAFSNDDTVFYQAASAGFVDGVGHSRLEIFDIASFSQEGEIDLGRIGYQDAPIVHDMVVDGSGAYIFVSTSGYGSAGQLRVYATGRGTPPAIPPMPPKAVLNVSTRLRVDASDGAGIGGFIIKGNVPKKVMLRAIGPSLSEAGVSGALVDPVLEVYNSAGQRIGRNDNWNSNRIEVLFSGLAPSDEHESALSLTLQPGAYTAVVRGVTADPGVALVEMYDLSAIDARSKLANISTRGTVGRDDSVMIGGFIIGGDQVTRTVVRAMGPSLANYGVGGALGDPALEVYDGNGALVAQDDDWRMYQAQILTDTGLAPTDDRESAMLLFLQPGAYTAVVRGKDNSTGVGLVEIFNLDAN